MNKEKLINFQREVERELTSNILPFWAYKTIDEQHGGFYGYITNDLAVKKHASRGAVLFTRLLWTFSRAYAFFKDEIYLERAHRAYHYLCDYFVDAKYGGIFWELNFKGQPRDKRKQLYAQAFAIYALTEYYQVTKANTALDQAKSIFKLLEEHAFDVANNGYFDACERDWKLSRQMFLKPRKYQRAKKSMNTQLHILEAYTNLLRCWPDAQLKEQLKKLLLVFKTKIVNSVNYHFQLFFTSDWQVLDKRFSYGHDIEGSWLLTEAAELLGEEQLTAEISQLALDLVRRSAQEGISPAGGIWNEGSEQGLVKDDYDWWPQAEAMVGFLNAYEQSMDEHYLDLAISSWDFIKKYFIDRTNGEWFWRIDNNLTVNYKREKVGTWKCPYHNTRACLEVSTRSSHLLTK